MSDDPRPALRRRFAPLSVYGEAGMGGGFYDRHFTFLRHRKRRRRPLLVGLAFETRRLERLPSQMHDVPLWRILTERNVHGGAGARR